MRRSSRITPTRLARPATTNVIRAVAVALAVGVGVPAAAQEHAGEQNRVGTPNPLYFSLGIAALSSPRPYVGATNTTTPLPIVELYYKRLYVQGTQAGFHLLRNDDFAFGVRGHLVLAGLEPDSSPFLGGMEERGSSIEGGVVFDWTPGEYKLSATAFTDLLGRSNGQQVGLDFSRTWTFDGMRYGLVPSVGAVWQSADFVDYYAGVRPQEVRPDRPAFRGETAINFRASVTGYVFLTRQIQLVGQANLQRLDNEIYDSPIVDKRHGVSGFVGVAYRFGS